MKITWEMIEKAADAVCDSDRKYWTVNRWQKSEAESTDGNRYDRTYINICQKNHRCNKRAGYWDMLEDKYVPPVKGINLLDYIDSNISE